jgi:thiol-disulfide isomerase/thioredoxin
MAKSKKKFAFLFKKEVNKEIFFAVLILMLVFAVVLNNARNRNKLELSKQSPQNNIFNPVMPPRENIPFEDYNTEEALDRITQNIENDLTKNWFQENIDDPYMEYLSFFENKKGRKIMVVFWSSWNRASMDYLDLLPAMLQDPTVSVIAIAEGQVEKTVLEYLETKNYPFPILSDSAGEIFFREKILKIPTTLFYDSEHKLQDSTDGVLTLPQIYTKLRFLS